MTKKLEELFNLPPADVSPEEAQAIFEENKEIIAQVDDAIDKIDSALPLVRDLDAGDEELDELAKLAKEKFEDIMQIKIADHTHNGFGWNDVGINGRFQSCIAGVPQVFHCDAQQWAAVIYLTPDAPPQSGTSFYRNKKSKVFHNSSNV